MKFETVENPLRLIFYHVFSNVEILQRLLIELGSIPAEPSDSVELRTTEQLSYLTLVITQGLRLSPSIATRSARTVLDTELIYDKQRIPAGMLVGITSLSMYMDRVLYSNPMSFKPDRWMDLDANARKKANKTLAPFIKGTRICTGMQ